MVQHVVNHKKSSMFAACEKRHDSVQTQRFYAVKYMWVDNKFEPSREDILSIRVTL